VLRYAMISLIIVVISYIHLLVPVIRPIRPGLTSVGIVTVVAYLNPTLLVSGSLLRSLHGKLLALLFVVACLSIPFGISMGNSGKFMIESYVKVMFFAFLVIATIRHAKDLYTICWAFLISCGVLAYLALFVYQLVDHGTYHRIDTMHMYDANDAGCVFAGGIGIGLLLFRTSGSRFARTMALGLVLAIFAAIAKTGSRGAFVGALAVAIGLLVFDRGAAVWGRFLKVGLGAATITLFAPHGYWMKIQSILEPESDYNYTAVDGRKQLAIRGFQYMTAYPVFGLGIDNFSKAECSISEKARNAPYGTPVRCTAPHNTLVQVGAELGWMGFLTWFALLGGGVLVPFLSKRRMPAHWKNGDAEERFLYSASGLIPVGIVGFAVASSFVSFAWLDTGYLLFAMVAGYQVSVEHKLRQNVIHPPPTAMRAARPPGWRSMRHRDAATQGSAVVNSGSV
jgi:O-antigen ligase